MKSPRKKDMQVSYPVAMTRRITLHHNLTQTHFQRFFQQASARMASIQGLRVNEDTDEEILRIEGMFKEIIAKAIETLGASQQHWKERLEGAGFDPDMSSVQGGLEFDAPITTPWSNKYLEVYRRCDDALMLVEMAWIAEELESVIDKRNAVAEVRKPLVETARQIQRAVTQAFQESRQRDEGRSKKSARVPEAWGRTDTMWRKSRRNWSRCSSMLRRAIRNCFSGCWRVSRTSIRARNCMRRWTRSPK
ncbi:hypothetical protein BI364_07310 [Acidihalobacter yilgarnensis]|uniref:Uncharacterized protein n=1 Tax=Acidihalobacter yilgarnensis TaxID=2819280 RepID=A0A1D8IMU3_9GAMM|nr:hypothetical protein [Acidihalobacter yilgarnensis]AOU97798.1 hypothetical protein BI364_07310 [Acidihalobacter yilgarnensis]